MFSQLKHIVESTGGQVSSTIELHRSRIAAQIANLQPGLESSLGEVSAFFDLQAGVLRAGFPLGEGSTPADILIPKSKGALAVEFFVQRSLEGTVMFGFQCQHATQPPLRFAALTLNDGVLASAADLIRAAMPTMLKDAKGGEAIEIPLSAFVDEAGQMIEEPPFALTTYGLSRWHTIAFSQTIGLRDRIVMEQSAENVFQITFVASRILHDTDRGVAPIHGVTEQVEEVHRRVLVGKHLLTLSEYEVLQAIESEFDQRELGGLTHKDLREIAQHQFEDAWRWRKYTSGDEKNHPQDRDWEVVDIAQVLTATRMTVEMLSNWRALGREGFKKMRQIGEALVQIGSALPDKPGFTERVLMEGVPLRNGQVLQLPTRRVLSAAFLHHEGWIKMREDMRRYASDFSLPELTPLPRPEQVHWKPTAPDSAWVPDSRNFLGHCFMLGLHTELADRIENALFGSDVTSQSFHIPATHFAFSEKGQRFVFALTD